MAERVWRKNKIETIQERYDIRTSERHVRICDKRRDKGRKSKDKSQYKNTEILKEDKGKYEKQITERM